MNDKQCPICGKGRLLKLVKTETFEYKGHKIKITGYVVYVCSNCKEEIVDPETLFKADIFLSGTKEVINEWEKGLLEKEGWTVAGDFSLWVNYERPVKKIVITEEDLK